MIRARSHAAGAHLVEALVDGVVEVIEHSLHVLLGGDWVDELHGVDLVHDVAVLLTGKVHLDLGHGGLLLSLSLGVGEDADGTVVEEADSLHHANGLPEWAVVIVIGEGVLLEELILDDSGGL